MCLVFVATLLVMGCSTDATGDEREPGYVSRADLGDDWPLTVEKAVVSCEPFTDSVHLPIVKVGDVEYGLTGQAVTQGYTELADDDPVWADNPRIDGAKVNIGPLRDHALGMCE